MFVSHPRLKCRVFASLDMIHKEDYRQNQGTIEGNFNLENIGKSY